MAFCSPRASVLLLGLFVGFLGVVPRPSVAWAQDTTREAVARGGEEESGARVKPKGPRRMPKGRVALDPNAAVAKLPGFEILPNGKSRVFVQLSKTPVVEEKRGAGGALMYVLKDVHVERRNNTNPLLTMHWNTPVSRAQLVPSGSDLQFVIDLRTPVAPEWKLVNAEGGASVLMIEFASGSYLSRRSEPAPLPQARRNKRESNAPPEKVSLQGDGAGDPLDGNSEEESSSSGRAEPMPERDTAAAGSASR